MIRRVRKKITGHAARQRPAPPAGEELANRDGQAANPDREAPQVGREVRHPGGEVAKLDAEARNPGEDVPQVGGEIRKVDGEVAKRGAGVANRDAAVAQVRADLQSPDGAVGDRPAGVHDSGRSRFRRGAVGARAGNLNTKSFSPP